MNELFCTITLVLIAILFGILIIGFMVPVWIFIIKIILKTIASASEKASGPIISKQQFSNSKTYLNIIKSKLINANFTIIDSQAYKNRNLILIARRSRFEIEKFGYSEKFFIVSEFNKIDTNTMRIFSSICYEFAMKNRKNPLPCGLFESVHCFSLAIVHDVDQNTINWIEQNEPPQHFASAEIPVIFNITSGRLHFIQITPLWGMAYYGERKENIRQFLNPN